MVEAFVFGSTLLRTAFTRSHVLTFSRSLRWTQDRDVGIGTWVNLSVLSSAVNTPEMMGFSRRGPQARTRAPTNPEPRTEQRRSGGQRRAGPTRSHPEHGRETALHRHYCSLTSVGRYAAAR